MYYLLFTGLNTQFCGMVKTMFEFFSKRKRYFNIIILLVLIFMLVVNLAISGRKNKKAIEVKDHSRKEHHGARDILQRRSSMIKKSELNILKRKTFIEDCADYNYKMEDLPSCPDTMKRRFPTALVAGVSKGGTTTLLRFLNVHPRIAARDGKNTVNRYTAFFTQKKKTYEWYKNLMPCSNSNQITMERSPAYLNCQRCPKAILKFNSKIKVIFIFREPTERAFSQYLMDKRNSKHGNKTFEEVVLAENFARVQNNSSYIFVSRYQEHIHKWLREFPLEQMLFLDGHAFISNPSDVLNGVEDFLGIERFFTKDLFKLGDKGKYCLVMDEGDPVCPPPKKGASHPKMKERTRNILNTYFKPLNTEFFRLISKRFEWGY